MDDVDLVENVVCYHGKKGLALHFLAGDWITISSIDKITRRLDTPIYPSRLNHLYFIPINEVRATLFGGVTMQFRAKLFTVVTRGCLIFHKAVWTLDERPKYPRCLLLNKSGDVACTLSQK